MKGRYKRNTHKREVALQKGHTQKGEGALQKEHGHKGQGALQMGHTKREKAELSLLVNYITMGLTEKQKDDRTVPNKFPVF